MKKRFTKRGIQVRLAVSILCILVGVFATWGPSHYHWFGYASFVLAILNLVVWKKYPKVTNGSNVEQ
jgi:hypothetical protein